MFHIDHIVPLVSGGETVSENLALACVSCSLRKGAKEFAIVEGTKEKIRLFHPRKDNWNDHFEWHGAVLKGKTLTGKMTIELLKMNRQLILAVRDEEILLKRHPG